MESIGFSARPGLKNSKVSCKIYKENQDEGGRGVNKNHFVVAAMIALTAAWCAPAFAAEAAKPKSESSTLRAADKETRARLDSALKSALHIKKLTAKDPMICQPWAKSEMPGLLEDVERIIALGRVDRKKIDRVRSHFNVMYSECEHNQMKWSEKDLVAGIAGLQELISK
jgi:hypothetical protein